MLLLALACSAQESEADAERAMIEQLEALGYATGTVDAPTGGSGITRHDPKRAHAGLNLYSSGHGPEALLMDMDGRPLHRWRFAFRDAWPDFPAGFRHPNMGYWRRVHLYENGDLLAIFDGLGILRVDRDSKLVWASAVRAHHDLEIAANGEIFVLSAEAGPRPDLHPSREILEDFVSVLDPATGEELRRISLLAALERSPWAKMLDRRRRELVGGGDELADLFHTNSLRVLDGSWSDRHPAFRRGNLLVSILKLDALAVVDVASASVAWVHTGRFRLQHDPRPLANGNLLLFDNLGLGPGRSRVLELDLLSGDPKGRVAWSFKHSRGEPLHSRTCGTARRLPGGNTLITESDGGRALEVTSGGEVVWEFTSPHRVGAGGERIATLFEVVRLPPDFPIAWSDAARGSATPE